MKHLDNTTTSSQEVPTKIPGEIQSFETGLGPAIGIGMLGAIIGITYLIDKTRTPKRELQTSMWDYRVIVPVKLKRVSLSNRSFPDKTQDVYVDELETSERGVPLPPLQKEFFRHHPEKCVLERGEQTWYRHTGEERGRYTFAINVKQIINERLNNYFERLEELVAKNEKTSVLRISPSFQEEERNPYPIRQTNQYSIWIKEATSIAQRTELEKQGLTLPTIRTKRPTRKAAIILTKSEEYEKGTSFNPLAIIGILAYRGKR
jgi:hypothetical protein